MTYYFTEKESTGIISVRNEREESKEVKCYVGARKDWGGRRVGVPRQGHLALGGRSGAHLRRE